VISRCNVSSEGRYAGPSPAIPTKETGIAGKEAIFYTTTVNSFLVFHLSIEINLYGKPGRC